MARFQTAFVGKFEGFKQPYKYTHRQSGEEREAAGKLQFVVSDDRGRAELMDVSESQWQAAGGPAVAKIAEGDRFKLTGFVQLNLMRDGDSYFVVQVVEPLAATVGPVAKSA